MVKHGDHSPCGSRLLSFTLLAKRSITPRVVGYFTGATKVTFGGVKATQFTVVSDIEIIAKVPTGAKTGFRRDENR
jgi:hypothetical protein